MPSCAAFVCHNQQFKGSGKTFHKFPLSNKPLVRQWVISMKRDKWYPVRKSVLCSDHFEEPCFDRTGQTVRLRPLSIPTIFTFPQRLKKTVKARQPPRDRSAKMEGHRSQDVEQQGGSSEQVDAVENIVLADPKQCAIDHSHVIKESPRKLKRKFEQLEQKATRTAKRLKVERQKTKRLKRKISSLQEIVSDLRLKMISEPAADMLEKTFSGVPKEIMKRMLESGVEGKKTRKKYEASLRAFACTLHFYSAKAYDYVRETFNLALPHPSTIRSWYSAIDGNAGFSKEAFHALSVKVKEAAAESKKVLCSLMLDEMSIRKHTEWDDRKEHYVGFVDIGNGIEDDSLPEATEVLVFMVVCLNHSWKVPVAYFLINGLGGSERANLVLECLKKLNDVGVCITSLTCDGPNCHMSMISTLGANLDLTSPQCWFPHPSTQGKVYVLLDVCHMMKLVRGCLSGMHIIKNSKGEDIKWQYINDLHIIQETEGLRAGNKLRVAHINWRVQKMKVNLATQTLSKSVADGIEFCNIDLKLQQFKDSEATVEFIKVFDRLFDLLNSRNPLGKHFKAPMRISNQHLWRPFLTEACAFIIGLTDVKGTRIINCPKKTGFVGFYISALSSLGVFDDYVAAEGSPLNYLLTYKLSQDHIELFFCAVRSRGGWNNNPTVKHFVSAWKQLLIHHEIKTGTGNVAIQDETKILYVTKGSVDTSKTTSIDTLDISLAKRYDLLYRLPECQDHDYADIPNFFNLSEYADNVIAYIAGFVVRNLSKVMKCPTCCQSLSAPMDNKVYLKLLKRKSAGGLTVPSRSVVNVCRATERCVRRLLNANRGSLPSRHNVKTLLCMTVLSEVTSSTHVQVFEELQDEHMFESEPQENHVYNLIKAVAAEYLKIRLYHLGKQNVEHFKEQRVRKTLTKQILFLHQ